MRTGRRASALADLLNEGGLVADVAPRSAPRIDDLRRSLAEDIFDLYRTLGGRLDRPALRPGAWDLSMDGVLVELDEELHFNRYRDTTLRRPWAAVLPWTAPYVHMCRDREVECMRAAKWGRRWTSESSARMFGDAAQPGDVSSEAGAPRWKQRALYDAMKDAIAAQNENVKVARLSVYDEVSGRPSRGRTQEPHVLGHRRTSGAAGVANLVVVSSRLAASHRRVSTDARSAGASGITVMEQGDHWRVFSRVVGALGQGARE